MIINIWKLIKMSFGCSKEEVENATSTTYKRTKAQSFINQKHKQLWVVERPFDVALISIKSEGANNMKNLKSNVMETVAMNLGVGFNEPFVLTAENGVKFVAHIDENGIYNESSGSYLNGNTLMKVIDGKLRSEELPWCPKIGEHYYTAVFDCDNKIILVISRVNTYDTEFLCRLNAGLIFPLTNDNNKKEEYRQTAFREYRRIMGQYGIKGDIK